jgi:hypothetical protein
MTTPDSPEQLPRNAFGFAVVFVIALMGCLGAALAINVLGNGTNLFPSPFFPASTCIRAWKARHLAQLAQKGEAPRVLVMGSSRVFALEERDVQAITGLTTFNFGVSVGCPVDFIAQLRFAVDVGVAPKIVVLGVDELSFGENPEADHYDMQLVTDDRLFHQLALRDRIPILAQAMKTVSLSSTIQSSRNLWHRLRSDGFLMNATEPPDSALEGARPADWDGLSAQEQERRLAAGIDEKVAFWGRYLDRPDKVEGMRPTRRKLDLLEMFLDLAAARGTAVYVVLLPVHPEFERRAFSPAILEIRAQLGKDLAASCLKHGFVFRDYTDLDSFGGAAADFTDGTHMNPRNGHRLLARLFDH